MKNIIWISALLVSLLVSRASEAVTVVIDWAFPDQPNLAGYRIYYTPVQGSLYGGVVANEGPSPVDVPLSALADAANPSFSISGMPTCSVFNFSITATYQDGSESPHSPAWEWPLTPSPELVEVGPGLSEGVLAVSWEGLAADDPGGVAEYRVHYDVDSGEPYEGVAAGNGPSPVTVPPAQLALPLTGLEPGSTLYVMVEAVCPDDTGAGSEEGSGVVAEPECDNQVIEAGESCDPPDTCPAECDDGNVCTSDQLLGDPSQCTASCEYTPITTCAGGDGCCPDGCDNNSDSDCSVSCDNNIIEQGETCDPPGSCPTNCSDGVACTDDALIGSAANCSAACSYSPITACDSGDGCCPPGCDKSSDSDCSDSCGDGIIGPGETCDPPGSCPTDCDDGVACTADDLIGSAASCGAACAHTTITTCLPGDGCCPPGCDSSIDEDCSDSCGNGIVDQGETCDPPGACPATCDDLVACTVDVLTGSASSCSVACSITAITECDSGDDCCPPGCDQNSDSDCSASCGDGIVDQGETCDPPGSCPTDCNDGNVCTRGLHTGSAASCSAACSYMPVTACGPDDGCCPPGCDVTTDGDCKPNLNGQDQPPSGKPIPGAPRSTLTGGCSAAPGSAPGAGLFLLLLALVPTLLRRRDPR